MNNDPLHDLFRVVSVNLGALIISVSGAEIFIRLFGLLAACVYTLLKIYDWFDARRSK